MTVFPVNNLRAIREQIGESQEESAKALGIPIDVYQKLEQGKKSPNRTQMEALKSHFNSTLNELAGIQNSIPGSMAAQLPKPNLRAETELLLKAMEHFVLDAFTSAEMSFDYPPELLHEAIELGKWLLTEWRGGDAMTETIGARIAALREEKGWTARQLARKADLADESVISIEEGRGNPTVKTLEKIAEALGCTVGDLVG